MPSVSPFPAEALVEIAGVTENNISAPLIQRKGVRSETGRRKQAPEAAGAITGTIQLNSLTLPRMNSQVDN